jgi:hypothetical protein
MIRLLPLVIVLVVALVVVRYLARTGAEVAERSRRVERARAPRGAREWDRRRDQVKRQLRGIDGPTEHRDEMLRFIEGHHGVEAYVEPKTVVSPLSVVLVDVEGTWRRFELKEDRVLRQLAKTHGVRTFDASIVGYPPRMRRTQEPPDA